MKVGVYMEKIWHDLYREAKNKLSTKEIPPFIESGTSACAIEAGNGQIYSGISITSNTSINVNAEKSAIISMFNDNEFTIKKIVILNELEEVIPPSTECFEYILELNIIPDDIEILTDYDQKTIAKVRDLLPDWWGTYRNKK